MSSPLGRLPQNRKASWGRRSDWDAESVKRSAGTYPLPQVRAHLGRDVAPQQDAHIQHASGTGVTPRACRASPRPRQPPSLQGPWPCPRPQLARVLCSRITEFLNDFLKISGLRPAVKQQLRPPSTDLEGPHREQSHPLGQDTRDRTTTHHLGRQVHSDTEGRAGPLGRELPRRPQQF